MTVADWVKLWTSFHDDPSIQNLSPKAIVYYVNAISWCGAHDRRDGVYVAIGRPPACVAELVAAGKFEPAGDGCWRIHGFPTRQKALFQMLDARAEAGRVGGLRSGEARRTKAEANAKLSLKQTAKQTRTEKSREEKEPADAGSSRLERRELAKTTAQQQTFQAVCEAMGYDIGGLGPDDQREIGGIAAALVAKGLHPNEVLSYVEWLVGDESPIVGGRRLTLHSVPKWVKDWRAAPRVVNGNGASKVDRVANIQRNLAAIQSREGFG